MSSPRVTLPAPRLEGLGTNGSTGRYEANRGPGALGRLSVVLACLLHLSSCMWMASPRCLADRAGAPPLFVVQMLEGRRWLPEYDTSDWEAFATVRIHGDGYVRHDNLQYPWCRRLDPDRMEILEFHLEDLRPLARESDEPWTLARRDELRSPVVSILWPTREGPNDRSPPRLSWSPLAPDSRERARALDGLFCVLEASMGHGFRYTVDEHFGEFLAQRGREAPCTEEDLTSAALGGRAGDRG